MVATFLHNFFQIISINTINGMWQLSFIDVLNIKGLITSHG